VKGAGIFRKEKFQDRTEEVGKSSSFIKLGTKKRRKLAGGHGLRK